jgi:hypothetical protein
VNYQLSLQGILGNEPALIDMRYDFLGDFEAKHRQAYFLVDDNVSKLEEPEITFMEPSI